MRVPDPVQHEEKRSDATQTRDTDRISLESGT
jgi:hypothetical protein